MAQGLRAVVLVGLLLCLTGCGAGGGVGQGDSGGGSGGAATAPTLTVSPASVQSHVAMSSRLTATLTTTDGGQGDVSSRVSWTSSNPEVAVVDKTGKVRALSPGSATIVAELTGLSARAVVGVTLVELLSLQISPVEGLLTIEGQLGFTATGTYADNTVGDVSDAAAWASSAPGVATVASGGVATAVETGRADITATVAGVQGASTLTVVPTTLLSIDVLPAERIVGQGTTQQYTATGHFSDGTTADLTPFATWDTSNHAVVTISNAPGSQGLATCVGVGRVQVTATLYGVTGHASLFSAI